MNVAVFCGSSLPHSESLVEAAAALGQALGSGGHTLVYGGSNLGLMGTVSSAALQAGGRVVGIIPTLFGDAIIRSQPVTELILTTSMAERKEQLLRISDAFVALPGGIGTLDEASEVMVANQLHQMRDQQGTPQPDWVKPLVLLNVDHFFDPLLAQLQTMSREGLMRPQTDMGLRVADTVGQALELLTHP